MIIYDGETIFDVLVRAGSTSESLISVLVSNGMTYEDTEPSVIGESYSVIASASYNFQLTGDYRGVFEVGEKIIIGVEYYTVVSVGYVSFVNKTTVAIDEFALTSGETYEVFRLKKGTLKDFTSEINITSTNTIIPDLTTPQDEEDSTTGEITAIDGQSIFDICSMTYGSSEFLIKLLQDSNFDSINLGDIRGNKFTYDKNLVKDKAVYNNRVKNGIIYGTRYIEDILDSTSDYLTTESGEILLTESGDYILY